jgi:putative oxidoreductase
MLTCALETALDRPITSGLQSARLLRQAYAVVEALRSAPGKWDGFLLLNEVAVLLFSSEFQLHLPGGPYAFRCPRWWRSPPARR